MNRYYHPDTLRILSESQLRLNYTNTCFPEPFEPPSGWFLLKEPGTQPQYDPVRQRLVDQTPVFADGVYSAVLTVDTYPAMIQEERRDLEVRRLEAKIDADVDSIYARVIGNRTVEYQIAYAEAKAWSDSGFVGDPPFSVTAHVDAYGITAQASAEEILEVGNRWYGLVRTLRQSRLKAKGLARQHKFIEAEAFWASVMNQVAA
jgi:hypothetical protein